VNLQRVLAALGLGLSVGVLAAMAAGVAARGDDAVVVEIDIHWSHFTPTSVQVPLGVPVTFVTRNDDPIDHEWIVGDALVHQMHRTGTEQHHGARPTELSIAALQTVETMVTFPASGSLQFICHLPGHEQYGMVGTLDIR